MSVFDGPSFDKKGLCHGASWNMGAATGLAEASSASASATKSWLCKPSTLVLEDCILSLTHEKNFQHCINLLHQF